MSVDVGELQRRYKLYGHLTGGETDALLDAVVALRKHIENLQNDRVLTCVYCGKAYEPGTPSHGTEVLTEHIKVCPDHPMAALRTQLAKAEGALATMGRFYDIRTGKGALQVRDVHVILVEMCRGFDKPWGYWREEEADAETE